MNRFTVILACIIALSGCATAPRDPNDPFDFAGRQENELKTRKEAYERLATFLKKGMTRRQVYALFPPYSGPIPTQHEVPSPFVDPPWRIWPQFELHPLDPEFRLRLCYDFADPTPQSRVRGGRSKQNPNDRLHLPPIVERSKDVP